jgi:hypothetical protein
MPVLVEAEIGSGRQSDGEQAACPPLLAELVPEQLRPRRDPWFNESTALV